ncbi:hypothetical protein [Collimonas humicola]|uniref:hypothetical protein n=1 Tax=Collimonas humicola TaxID=2825886 RepID=UPI001B8BD296|nr:hypothetical protein [Collimonas humicola]
MRIRLNPQRRDDSVAIVKQGDKLIINGEVFDFSVIPDGAILLAGAVACEYIVGNVERVEGDLHLTLTLPHGENPPQHVAFPDPILNPPDGPLELPQ